MSAQEPTRIFEQVGESFIQQAISEFYRRAVRDPIIGHFFFHSDIENLVVKQCAFTAKLLGSKTHKYTGKPLVKAHSMLPLTKVHFSRRQVLMAEVLQDLGLKKELSRAWLNLEEGLRPLIINSESPCHSRRDTKKK
ncbi:MAG: group 1 truncated hemoglobin [Oligoflexales bacterium]|nr:group 1 truncated hemoglobin [Oligoflexales bacterium]